MATELDEACEMVKDIMLKEAAEQEKMKPYLDKQLWAIQKLDNKINWYEKKIKEIDDKFYDLICPYGYLDT